MTGESLPHFSKYELLGVLGQGSMGVVYQAQHKMLGRVVALKVPHQASLRGNAAERFLREGRALAMLQHPNVVRIHDADEENGVPYIVMEYIAGGTLSDYIRESKQLSLANAERWGVEIAEALHYIHQKGILHRDLKSANVLITSEGKARITDFGIAQIDTHATITNGLLGTPAYMSPEQARGEEIDQRSDIYSLGVILYEALTGHLPFMNDNGLALIQQILSEVHDPVESYRPDTPIWFIEVVERCLQKDPDARFQTGVQVAQGLQNPQKNTWRGRVTSLKNALPLETATADVNALMGKVKIEDLRSPTALAFYVVSLLVLIWIFFLMPQDPAREHMASPTSINQDSSTVESDSLQVQSKSSPSWQPWR